MKQKSESKRIGIWIRVSTEDQARGDSPEHHERRARAYAEAKGWKVQEVYHLAAVSGKLVLAHPEAQRMLEDMKSGHITGLIFSKLARLARNTRELLEISDTFRQYDADLISLQEAIDTTSPAGRLFYTMIAAMAQWEREEIADRVAASVPIRAKLGKPLGGQAPFGYQWKDKKLIPHPQEAPVRKLMYELFLEHRRKKTVARLLNERGYRTRNGSKFSDTTIVRLLEDSTAKGSRRANYTKSTGDGKHWVSKPPEEWIHIPVEAIISEEMWAQCNAILEDQRKAHRRPGRKAVQLFSGLTYCHCGQKMYVPSNTPKYVCYKCRNKIPVADMDGIFHEQLKALFFSPDDMASYLKQADAVVKEKEELLSALSDERKKLEREMNKLYDLYLAGEVKKEGFGKKYNPLEERVSQIDDQIPQLQGEIDFLKIRYLSSDEVFSAAKDLYTHWPELNSEEKRKIVEAITERIVIDKDEVAINLCYIPSQAEMMAEKQHNLTPALPFCHITAKIEKSKSYQILEDCRTIGDHLKRKRLILDLRQIDVAEILGTDHWTLANWEKGKTKPLVWYYPEIANFLGYCPYERGETLGERIALHRRYRGLSQRELAQSIGVDPGSIARWENGDRKPIKQIDLRLRQFFDIS